MNSQNFEKSQPRSLLSRIIAPVLLVVAAGLVYTIVVFESAVVTAVSLIITVALFFGYSRISGLKTMLAEAVSRDSKFLIWVGIVIAIIVPLTLRSQPYIIHILVIAGISIILALGLNFQVGSTGIPNLGYAAFYGVGAYASALLSTRLGISFWLSILAAGLIAALFGFLVGLPALKTRTYHMALVSIAFGLVTYIMLNNLGFTGGPNGIKNIPSPELFGWSLFSTVKIFGKAYPVQLNYYYLVLVFMLLTGVFANFLYRSKIGLFWNAVREDEIAAKCSGINVSAVKLLSFSMGAFVAGLAGSLYAHFIGYISPENFNMNTSLLILGMVIMGGMDNILGVGIGAFILTIVPEKFRSLADFRMLASGMIIILMLMFRPSGIIKQQIRIYSEKFGKRIGLRGVENHG
jgi:ABC-type branched-subunit amino acid transport system permease subunit